MNTAIVQYIVLIKYVANLLLLVEVFCAERIEYHIADCFW